MAFERISKLNCVGLLNVCLGFSTLYYREVGNSILRRIGYSKGIFWHFGNLQNQSQLTDWLCKSTLTAFLGVKFCEIILLECRWGLQAEKTPNLLHWSFSTAHWLLQLFPARLKIYSSFLYFSLFKINAQISNTVLTLVQEYYPLSTWITKTTS